MLPKLLLLFCLLLFTFNLNSKNYKIVGDLSSKESYSVYLQIPEEITREAIKKIFNNIKYKKPNYQKYFLYFYLPQTQIKSKPWAKITFNKKLTIEVSREKQKNLLGTWKNPMLQSTIQLKNTQGYFLITEKLNNGLVVKHNVNLKEIENKIIFEVTKKPRYYYTINEKLQLEFWNQQVRISRYNNTKPVLMNEIIDQLKKQPSPTENTKLIKLFHHLT